MLSCLLSKEAIWKWQVARWRRGSDDDKYLMRSSLNNSSRLEWIIEMMAMNHEEGPDLISLSRNSRDYSCTRLLWKKLLMCFIFFFSFFISRTHRAYGKILLRKSLSGKIEEGLIIFMQLQNRYVLNGIWLNSITKKWLRRAHMHYISVNTQNETLPLPGWLALTIILCCVTFLDYYGSWGNPLFFRWVNRCFKQLRKIL